LHAPDILIASGADKRTPLPTSSYGLFFVSRSSAADQEAGPCRNAKASFIFFGASNFSGWVFFLIFSESAQTPSHMPFLREAPLLASYPIARATGRSASASLDGHACALAPQVADNAII
jgi:hypothetical protein